MRTADDRIRDVLRIHEPRWNGLDQYGHTITVCANDGHPWPCRTVRTLKGDQ